MLNRSLRIMLLLSVLLLSIPTSAEVTYLCDVTGHRGRGGITPVTFLTGQEVQQQLGYVVDHQQNYAILGGRLLELKATVLFLTETFGHRDFVRLFEVKGKIEAVSSSDQQECWTIQAKYPNLPTRQWVDPILNAPQSKP